MEDLSFQNLNPKARFIEVDISRDDELKDCKKWFDGVDTIFHTAARARVQPSIIDPISFNKTNTIIDSVKKTGRLVVVHEAHKFAGFGGEIVSQVVEKAYNFLKAAPERIGAPHTPVPYNQNLEQCYIPGQDEILEVVTRVSGK